MMALADLTPAVGSEITPVNPDKSLFMDPVVPFVVLVIPAPKPPSSVSGFTVTVWFITSYDPPVYEAVTPAAGAALKVGETVVFDPSLTVSVAWSGSSSWEIIPPPKVTTHLSKIKPLPGFTNVNSLWVDRARVCGAVNGPVLNPLPRLLVELVGPCKPF
jgi:hypothetical protein